MGTLTEQQQKVSTLLKKAPLIISGPCSAETEEQVMATAKGLAATGKVDIMRAGIWKPRTRPGSFEGIGTKGLPWICLLYTSPSPRDYAASRMPSSA